MGLQSYRNVLEPERAWRAISEGSLSVLSTINFWKALRFTLTFTLITLPLVIVCGLGIAVLINNAAQSIRGPVIFISLLPFIITPVIGVLSINWLFRRRRYFDRAAGMVAERDIALFAQAWTIEILMMLYRVWHVAPFAAIVFLCRSADRQSGQSGKRRDRRCHPLAADEATLSFRT